MALTKIDDRGLTTPIDLLDNEKIRFGTGNDLELYHDGSQSFLKDTGTGSFKICSNSLSFRNAGDSEDVALFLEDGRTEFYYNNSKKLETTNTGIWCSGYLSGEGLDIADNKKLLLGSGDDLEIYHDGSHSVIKNTTGSLYAATGAFLVQNAAQTESQIISSENGAVELFYDNVKKLETTSTGVTVNGKMLVDGAVAYDAFTSSSIHVDGYICMGRTDTTVGVDNGIGGLRFYSNDTNINSGDFLNVAAIDVMADGDFLSGDAPTRITFKTMTDGTTTLEEALRIDSQQRIGIGISSPTEKLHVIGQVGGSNPTAGSKWDIARFVAHDYSATNSGGLTIGAYWNNTTVSGRKAYIQSSQNTNSGSTARELVLNPDGGDVSIGDGNLVVANTHGIDFSATSGTGTSELLDDYEEGTFTPSISSTSRSGTITYTNQVGFYTKIGNRVFAQVYMHFSGGTNSSNAFVVDGLPFANVSTTSWEGGGYHTYMGGLFSAEADRVNEPWVGLGLTYVKFHTHNGSQVLGTQTSTGANYLIFHVQYVTA